MTVRNSFCVSGSSPTGRKRVLATLAALAALLLLSLSIITCGASKNIGNNSKPFSPSGPAPIDLQGNWVLTASDSGGRTSEIDVYLQQTGSTVTSTNLSVPISVDCVAFLTGSLVNGQVQNANQISGQIDVQSTSNEASFNGSFDFTGTLAPDGLSFTGGYSNMPSCLNFAPTGTFTGKQVPGVTGTWQGTLTPCDFNQSNGQCTATVGATSTTFSMALTQNNDGTISGTYSVTNMSPLSSGTLAGGLGAHFTNFQMTDSQNCQGGCGTYVFNNQYYGSLGFDRTLTGVLSGATGYNQYGHWLVSASHRGVDDDENSH